jgi:glucokinase
VIGGGVAKAGKLLFDPLRHGLQTYAGLDFVRGLRVLRAELGGEAGLVGAAALLRELDPRASWGTENRIT